MAMAIKGLDEVQNFIGAIADKMSDTDTLLKKIGFRITNEAVHDHFVKKESPDGEAWPDLNPDYKTQKIAKKGSVDVLIWNRKLADSVGFKVKDVRLFVGAGNEDVPYARIHDEGGETGRNHAVKMPVRKYLGFGKQESEIITEMVGQWIGDL